mgnify:CR=1 FL=1
MDMYQKRKIRQEKKNNSSNNNGLNKNVLNWYIPTYGKLLSKAYKYRLLILFLFTFYRQKIIKF